MFGFSTLESLQKNIWRLNWFWIHIIRIFGYWDRFLQSHLMCDFVQKYTSFHFCIYFNLLQNLFITTYLESRWNRLFNCNNLDKIHMNFSLKTFILKTAFSQETTILLLCILHVYNVPRSKSGKPIWQSFDDSNFVLICMSLLGHVVVQTTTSFSQHLVTLCVPKKAILLYCG
jgi:hypothetical protein